jgi:cytochrome c
MRASSVFSIVIAAPWLALASGEGAAAGDPARGASVFRACVACHSVAPGEHMTGPGLANVWHRKAGTVAGFTRYSDAMKRSDITWTDAALDKWLSNPERLLPGTSMSFPGLKESKDREDVIAYLKAVSENKAPKQAQGGRGMMMRGAKLELRKAPPEGQVIAMKYCGDTYTVETADGKTQKAWEFNLRFKTDSSKEGPLPGKPVIVGAGMQGDRASVVFSTPGEISSFIKPACK